MADKPAWLKKMEHGVIGEARAKAFLLDRFWVRSVEPSLAFDADFEVYDRGALRVQRHPPERERR